MTHILTITLKTSKSNISITDLKIGNWFINWQNNEIKAYRITEFVANSVFASIELLQHDDKVNLGLLIDILTICTNVDTNSSLSISMILNPKVYKLITPANPRSVQDFINLIPSAQKIPTPELLGNEWPIRINDQESLNFGGREFELIHFLLDFFKINRHFTNAQLKLLNYWRRGVDLHHLEYEDEGFLAFFKILEYFESKSNFPIKNIPAKYNTKSKQKAYRVVEAAKLRNPKSSHYKLVTELFNMRNNNDIAHFEVNSLPNERDDGLYYSYFDDSWPHYHHIKEVSRLLVFYCLGLKKLKLDVIGGLFELGIVKQ